MAQDIRKHMIRLKAVLMARHGKINFKIHLLIKLRKLNKMAFTKIEVEIRSPKKNKN